MCDDRLVDSVSMGSVRFSGFALSYTTEILIMVFAISEMPRYIKKRKTAYSGEFISVTLKKMQA